MNDNILSISYGIRVQAVYACMYAWVRCSHCYMRFSLNYLPNIIQRHRSWKTRTDLRINEYHTCVRMWRDRVFYLFILCSVLRIFENNISNNYRWRIFPSTLRSPQRNDEVKGVIVCAIVCVRPMSLLAGKHQFVWLVHALKGIKTNPTAKIFII